MSEVSYPFRKAIPIIIVTWILSMVTSLALVYYAPNILPRTWHRIEKLQITFEDFRETTNVVNVPSNRWRIGWEVGITRMDDLPESEVNSFTIYLDSNDTSTYALDRVTPADFEWRYVWNGFKETTGSGQFYIIVAGEHVRCNIIIEAYY